MGTGERKVRGIILAGVHAWGESVLERICPRPLLPIAGRPLVWYGLEWLRQAGLLEATVCANSDTRALRGCLEDGKRSGVALDYYEDVMPRGPAGCTRDAGLRSDAEDFVVIEGAVLPQVDLRAILRAHRQSNSALTLVAVEQRSDVDGTRTMAPAGIYIVSRSALDLVPSKGYQDIKEMWIPRLYQHGYRSDVYPVEPEGALRVMGADSYLRASVRVLERISGNRGWGDGYRRTGAAWVHESAHVSASAHLMGPSLIGADAVVERDAAVAGWSIVGPGSRIGRNAILNRVVAWSGCEVGAGAILSRCILLTGSSIEPELVVRDTICSRDLVEDLPGSQAAADYWGLRPPAESSCPIGGPMSDGQPRLPDPASGPSSVCRGGSCPNQARASCSTPTALS